MRGRGGLGPEEPNFDVLKTTTTTTSFFSQASWGRLEMKPERNKFKVHAH